MYKNTLSAVIVSSVVALLVTGCVSTQSTNGSNKPKNITVNGNGVPNYYLVKSGDTLSQISDKYNLNYRQLGQINNLDAKYTIFADQWIKLWETSANTAQNTSISRNESPSKKVLPSTIVSDGAYVAPTKNRIVRRFGESMPHGKKSKGVWYAGYEGDAVRASQNGRIIYAGDDIKEFGNLVMIQHANNIVTVYAHNDKVYVKDGDMVKKAQKIATMGKTGNTDTISLQFQVRKGRAPINPLSIVR